MHAFFFSCYNVQSYQFVQLRQLYSLNEMTNFFSFSLLLKLWKPYDYVIGTDRVKI